MQLQPLNYIVHFKYSTTKQYVLQQSSISNNLDSAVRTVVNRYAVWYLDSGPSNKRLKITLTVVFNNFQWCNLKNNTHKSLDGLCGVEM